MKAVYIQQHGPIEVCSLAIVLNHRLIDVKYSCTSRPLVSTHPTSLVLRADFQQQYFPGFLAVTSRDEL